MSIQKHAWHGRIRTKKSKLLVSLLNNQNGLTFLELFIALLIFSVIVSTVTPTLHFLSTHTQNMNDLRQYEWELFLIQLHRELKEANNIRVEGSEIIFTNKQGQIVNINHYQNLIRRQVAGRGHEIYLLNVKSVLFQKATKGIKLKVISEGGAEYKYTFRTYKEKM